MSKYYLLVAVLVLSFHAEATNYTVKASGGGNFTTIAACAAQMGINGTGVADTCTVFAGTYNETVTAAAGSVGNFKTFNVNASDTVFVRGFVAASYSKIVGFNIQSPSSPGSGCISIPDGSTQVYITSNVISQCGVAGASQINVGYPQAASFVYIQGNTLSYACVASGVQVSTTGTFTSGTNSMVVASVGGAQNGWVVYGSGVDVSSGIRITNIAGTTLTLAPSSGANPSTTANKTNTPITLSPPECNSIYAHGDHWLVENNDLSHYTLSIAFLTINSVYRNNKFHDQYQAEGGGNSHTDTFFSEPGLSVPVQFNVFEGNIQRNAFGPDSKGQLSQGESCGGTCQGLIYRFNVASRIGGGVISNNTIWDAVKSYNNDYVDTLADSTFACGNSTTNNSAPALITWATPRSAYLNDIYYYTNPAAHTGCVNPYQLSTTNGSSGTWGYNLAFCLGGCGTVYGHLYGTGTFASEPGQIIADPQFVSYVSQGSASNNFNLQSTSPARGAGTSLTTVTSGCNTSSLTLADASNFQDGYGLTGVQADWIRVGALTTGQISAIDYTTNVVTMTGSLSCTNGDAVYLYKKSDGVQVLYSTTPDIGAFPFLAAGPIVQLSCSSQPCTSLSFGAQLVGTQSASQTVTLTNTGTATLSITSIVASGDFTQNNNCGASVGVGLSCTINVIFTPTDQGARAGTITLVDNASGSPHTVPLTGTGAAPTIYRPTTFTDSGVVAVVNPTLAFDGDLTTFATGTADFSGGVIHPFTVVYKGFPVTIGTPLNAVLYLYNDSYNNGCDLGGEQAEYSLDGGTTWAQAWVGLTHGSQNAPLLEHIALPPSQQFSQVQARFGFASGGSGGSPCTLVTQMYEVWIQTGVTASTFQGGILFQGGNLIQ